MVRSLIFCEVTLGGRANSNSIISQPLYMKALCSFKMLGTMNLAKQFHIPKQKLKKKTLVPITY